MNLTQETENALQRLAGIWAEVLGVAAVTPAHTFFELGGDSIMVTVMVMQVEEAFNLIIDPGTVYDHPSLQAFATQLGLVAQVDQV